MGKFIEQHADKITGTLSCFDRGLFRGYLPIMSGDAMALFLKSQNIGRESLKPFLLEQAARLKEHAQNLCTRLGCPYIMHVGLQTWFPFRVQVYVNRHEWLARQLDHDGYAMYVNPLLGQEEVLNGMRYYWVTAQSEYSTDILFGKRANLDELMPRLCQYSILYFGATDVMTFLGGKLTGHFLGEVISDQMDVKVPGKRVPGRRVKHHFGCAGRCAATAGM